MKTIFGIGFLIICAVFLINGMNAIAEDGKILKPLSIDKKQVDAKNPVVSQGGFHSKASKRNILNLERDKPWGMPKIQSDAGFVKTLRILALRFDFRYENPDDANTTGRGKFDMRDTIEYKQEFGHTIDPSPHNRQYFEKHLEALNIYYSIVSEGKLALTWKVYPEDNDSVYTFPHTMGYYGAKGWEEVFGLEELSRDAIRLIDTAVPEIDFSQYDTYIIFHAGSDRQNDIGFPPTTSDLFTGNIFLGDTSVIPINNGQDTVRDVMIMPETACQDNRGTALNAVMAHEYGHQLGLVDLYSTNNFFTQVGDFSLMDNNGFGTGIDFGFDVGRIFGTMPIYPDAWSRCFLGFIVPVIYRQGAGIELVATEMLKTGTKAAKIPISEFEYYLLENRQMEIDGAETALLADSATSVILGPVNFHTKEFSREYDILIPGSGIIIWHIDERVAALDWNGDGYSNFEQNMLQINPDWRFLEIMEADGVVNFGGDYMSGFGDQQDMYYLGNNTSFTPNTNPPSIGNNGANSHIRITGISASDTTMTFDLEHDLASVGFPKRAGYPVYGLSPIAVDLDNDGSNEIIAVSGRNIIAMKEDGSDFTPNLPVFYDTAYSLSGKSGHIVPLFARTHDTITAGPVVGNFGMGQDSMRVAVGVGNWFYIFGNRDTQKVGEADRLFFGYLEPLQGNILSLIFDDSLLVAIVDSESNSIRLYNVDSIGASAQAAPTINAEELLGMIKLPTGIVVLVGDTINTRLYLISSLYDTVSFDLEGLYVYGPAAGDIDRDNMPEIVVATPAGEIKVIKINYLESGGKIFEAYGYKDLHDSIPANIIISDIDEDGYGDIIVPSINKLYVLDKNLIFLNDFPLIIDREFPYDRAVAAPVVADINGDKHQDIIVFMSNGNCYAFGPDLLYGFPLDAGGVGVGSPLVYKKNNGGGLGFLGVDGWFYSYDVGYDSLYADWPMGGSNPQGTFYIPPEKFGSIQGYAEKLPPEEFYCYPNPTLDGQTTIRCYLGGNASLTYTFYDLSGSEVDKFEKSGQSGTNENEWNGESLPTGVYRCILKANFGGETKTAFTDIAIVK